jgi:hypothetical protein
MQNLDPQEYRIGAKLVVQVLWDVVAGWENW